MNSEKRNDVAQTLNYVTFPFFRETPWQNPDLPVAHAIPNLCVCHWATRLALPSPAILCVHAQDPRWRGTQDSPVAVGLDSVLSCTCKGAAEGKEKGRFGV